MSEYVFKLPDLGEGTVEAEIVEWRVKVGDAVNEEDPIVDVMTDKATVEVSAPVSGRIKSLTGEAGESVAVGTPFIIFETDASAPAPVENVGSDAAEPAAADAPAAEPAGKSSGSGQLPVNRNGKVATSPAIRHRALEAGIDLWQIPGTGPRGRIVRKDFDDFLSHRTAATSPGPAAPSRASGTEEIKVIGLRRVIAERLSAAKRNIPHFAYVEEIDVTSLEALRVHMNERLDSGQTKLTFLPFIAMALVRALKDFPQCNATYVADRNVIVRHNAVHLGIATQTPDGLKVPVAHHAEAMPLHTLAGEIRRVTAAAKDNSAKRDELTGSTITLTSLGKLGGIASTPVINAPEVAIIGVNKAVQRPMIVDGQIAVRLMMNLSSSFDHRFVDGYDAAAMIQCLKDMLEHPATIFV